MREKSNLTRTVSLPLCRTNRIIPPSNKMAAANKMAPPGRSSDEVVLRSPSASLKVFNNHLRNSFKLKNIAKALVSPLTSRKSVRFSTVNKLPEEVLTKKCRYFPSIDDIEPAFTIEEIKEKFAKIIKADSLTSLEHMRSTSALNLASAEPENESRLKTEPSRNEENDRYSYDYLQKSNRTGYFMEEQEKQRPHTMPIPSVKVHRPFEDKEEQNSSTLLTSSKVHQSSESNELKRIPEKATLRESFKLNSDSHYSHLRLKRSFRKSKQHDAVVRISQKYPESGSLRNPESGNLRNRESRNSKNPESKIAKKPRFSSLKNPELKNWENEDFSPPAPRPRLMSSPCIISPPVMRGGDSHRRRSDALKEWAWPSLDEPLFEYLINSEFW